MKRACGFEKSSCNLFMDILIRFRFGYISRATPPLFNFSSIGSIDSQSQLTEYVAWYCKIGMIAWFEEICGPR